MGWKDFEALSEYSIGLPRRRPNTHAGMFIEKRSDHSGMRINRLDHLLECTFSIQIRVRSLPIYTMTAIQPANRVLVDKVESDIAVDFQSSPLPALKTKILCR